MCFSILTFVTPSHATESGCECPLCCRNGLAPTGLPAMYQSLGEIANKKNLLSKTNTAPVSECKLTKPSPNQRDDGADGSVGFPKSSDLAPSTGKRRGIVLHVDFPDVVAKNNQISTWQKRQISTAENFYNMTSYGKYKLKIDTSKKIYRIANNSSFYNLGFAHDAPNKDGAKTREIVYDAMLTADADIDFSKYDFVIVATPKAPSITLQGTVGAPSQPVDGVIFNLAILAPFDAITENEDAFKNTWLAHNIGHVLGLMHGFVPDYSNGTKPAAWDIMWNFAAQDDFIGWNKWKLGWIGDSQVVCLTVGPATQTTHLLSPIGQRGSKNKMIVIKINETTAFAIEVRRKTASDNISKKDEGVIVYRVDTTKGSNFGAYQILSNPSKNKKVRPGFSTTVGTLKQGNSFLTDGYRIKVVKSSPAGDLIAISNR